MQKHFEFEVGGVRYIGNQYPAATGIKIFARLVRLAGKPVAALLGEDFSALQIDGSIFSKLVEKKLNAAKMIEAVAEVADPHELESICKELLSGLEIVQDGRKRSIAFDIDFQGRIGHLFKVLGMVIKNQFADFFDAAGAQPDAPAKTPNRIQAI